MLAEHRCAICEQNAGFYELKIQHQGRPVSTHYCKECFYVGPLESKSALPEAERMALETIISTPESEAEALAELRMESVVRRAVATLDLLGRAYETADRDNDLQTQRACGLVDMMDRVDAALLENYYLMREHTRQLWRQRTALRMLAGLPLSERDTRLADADEGFRIARHAARNMTPAAPEKAGHLAA